MDFDELNEELSDLSKAMHSAEKLEKLTTAVTIVSLCILMLIVFGANISKVLLLTVVLVVVLKHWSTVKLCRVIERQAKLGKKMLNYIATPTNLK